VTAAAKIFDCLGKKKGRSRRSGQVQGGNAQEGPQRYEEELRNTALQQYASQELSNQVLKHMIR
jgi:hypothetical protein